jgi:predicted HicB family RNase H-like nuclease
MTRFKHPKEIAEEKHNKVTMAIRIERETKQALEETAEKYGISLTDLIISAINSYLEWFRKHEK